MDLAAIRSDLSDVARKLGFNAWDYPPDDPQNYPAFVVGGIRRMQRHNRAVTEIDIVTTFYASTADSQDATRTLDKALSLGAGDGFVDALDAIVDSQQKRAWSSIRFNSAGPYQRYTMPGGLTALGVELLLTLTG